jgi:hypothetical protein
MGYERCAELPLVASRLERKFGLKLRHLDIGSGEGVFPTYLLKNTKWDITCVDKSSSVQKQEVYAHRIMKGVDCADRFHVVEADLLALDLPPRSFDVITNISVIEHFEADKDSIAMEKSAKLLKVGGTYIFTTLMNDQHPKEFFVERNVYGQNYGSKPIFFQRHYDVASLNHRLIKPTGLLEKERVYFGDYGAQFFEHFIDIEWPWKAVKIAYQWLTPFFARRFLTYRDSPVENAEMRMHTASGVIVFLERGS